MFPRVSVVIPTYNSGRWVEETLRSVLRQTYPRDRLELIVIDDASPDDSVAIVRRVLEGQSIEHRIVVREKNGGVTSTRNLGWRMASGDWIQFLDADDLLAPHKIALQVACAVEAPHDVAVVYSNWQSYTLEGAQERDGSAGTWQATGPVHEPMVDQDTVVSILKEFAFGYLGPTLIRKAALPGIDGFIEQPNLGEDMDLMLRLAMAGGRFRKAPSPTAAFFYRQSPNSAWHYAIRHVPAMRNLLGTFKGAEAYLRAQSPDGDLSAEARIALARRYGRWPEFFIEHDPDSFRNLMAWLEGLGLRAPPDLRRRMRLLSRVIGYENALRLRVAVRRRMSRFR
jgi:glycosyltransferase involved in cell wall biosynthesis